MPADSVTSQQLDPLGCSFVMQNREDAVLAASTLSPGSLSCFTDGSRQNGLSGAGYVVYCDNTEWLSEAWSLGSYPTVFQAKLDAIGKLQLNSARNITNTEIIIHCDSKAARNRNGLGEHQICPESKVGCDRPAKLEKYCNHPLGPRTR